MSALVSVNNVYPEGKNGKEGCSVFPLLNMSDEKVTFLAHFSLDVDVNNISKYPKLTLYPVYLRNSYSVNNFNELADKKCFVFLCISNVFSSVLVYIPNLSKSVDYKGELEVVIRNDVVGDERGQSRLTFPGRNGVEFRSLNDKFQQAFNVLATDYLEFVKAVVENREEKPLRALKQKIKVDSFPKHLVRIESIARPIVTPASASAQPPVSGSEKKNFFTKLFS